MSNDIFHEDIKSQRQVHKINYFWNRKQISIIEEQKKQVDEIYSLLDTARNVLKTAKIKQDEISMLGLVVSHYQEIQSKLFFMYHIIYHISRVKRARKWV